MVYNGVVKENRYSKAKALAEDLRDLAMKHDVVICTAKQKPKHYSSDRVDLETRWRQQQEEGTWMAFEGL